MTDYIEEMMKTAGVNKIIQPGLITCWGGSDNREIYPPFDFYKLAKLIELIADENYLKMWAHIVDEDIENRPLTQIVAEVINGLMSMGKLDKNKVKEILEAEK